MSTSTTTKPLTRYELFNAECNLDRAVVKNDKKAFDAILARIAACKDRWRPGTGDLGSPRSCTPLDDALVAALHAPYYRNALLDHGAVAKRPLFVTLLNSCRDGDDDHVAIFDRFVASTKRPLHDINDDKKCPLLLLAVVNKHHRIVEKLLKEKYFHDRIDAYWDIRYSEINRVRADDNQNLITVAQLQQDSKTAAVLKNAGAYWTNLKYTVRGDDVAYIDTSFRRTERMFNAACLLGMLNENVLKEVCDYVFDRRALGEDRGTIRYVTWRG